MVKVDPDAAQINPSRLSALVRKFSRPTHPTSWDAYKPKLLELPSAPELNTARAGNSQAPTVFASRARGTCTSTLAAPTCRYAPRIVVLELPQAEKVTVENKKNDKCI